jgi:hypothetical protein
MSLLIRRLIQTFFNVDPSIVLCVAEITDEGSMVFQDGSSMDLAWIYPFLFKTHFSFIVVLVLLILLKATHHLHLYSDIALLVLCWENLRA